MYLFGASIYAQGIKVKSSSVVRDATTYEILERNQPNEYVIPFDEFVAENKYITLTGKSSNYKTKLLRNTFKVDFGSDKTVKQNINTDFDKTAVVVDENSNEIKFISMIDAVNYFSKLGYELKHTNINRAWRWISFQSTKVSYQYILERKD